MALTDLVVIPGGPFVMGDDASEPEEAPARTVSVSAFAIERTPVTNEQFALFVEATGHLTVAERPLDPADFPGVPTEDLRPGSMVFVPPSGPVDLRHLSQWWAWTPGASWRRPDGPGSSWRARPDHPVVHVAHEDAEAYALWADRSLPTEAEWERAARGGHDGRRFAWGDEATPGGVRQAKFWEGAFPWRNEASDGFPRTAPVGACCVPTDPRGPSMERSYDPAQPQFRIPRKVVKGGSFLCADEYCQRYRPGARRPQTVDTGMSHIGFRCVVRPTVPGPS